MDLSYEEKKFALLAKIRSAKTPEEMTQLYMQLDELVSGAVEQEKKGSSRKIGGYEI